MTQTSGLRIHSSMSHQSQSHLVQESYLMFIRLWNELIHRVHSSCFSSSFCFAMIFLGSFRFFHRLKSYAKIFFEHLRVQTFLKLRETSDSIHKEKRTFLHLPGRWFRFQAPHIQRNWFQLRILSKGFGSFEKICFRNGLIGVNLIFNYVCFHQMRFFQRQSGRFARNQDWAE